jgi:hypothetical protein
MQFVDKPTAGRASMTQHRVLALALLLGLRVASASQEKSVPNNSQAGQQKTVVGCLTGYDGHYTIGTSSDMLYILDGDAESFKQYNAKMVKASGTVTEPQPRTSKHNVLSQQPPTLKVMSLKKVADGCN